MEKKIAAAKLELEKRRRRTRSNSSERRWKGRNTKYSLIRSQFQMLKDEFWLDFPSSDTFSETLCYHFCLVINCNAFSREKKTKNE